MSGDPRELLVLGGTIRPHASHPTAEAMLIRDDRIVAVGTETDCRSWALGDVDVLDVDGGTVLAGFVDAHCHPLMFGQFNAWVDCSWEAAPAIDDVVAALTTRAAHGTGPVRGKGFHHGNVVEQRMLTRHDLDRVAQDREVLVFHSSGHGAIVNSWALSSMGVTADTVDPPGGHFGREADGTPDGTVWDAAADWLTGHHGVKITNNGPNFHLPDDPATLDAQLCAAQAELHAHGITTIVDAQVTGREFGAYLRTKQAGTLTMRAEMLVISSLLTELENLGICGRFGDDQLAIAGVKLYADGALTAGTARFSRPYCCSVDDFGYLYHPNGELAELISRVATLGLQAATHAQGDAAIQLVLDAHQSLGSRADARHRIEHFGAPTPGQVAQCRELGLWPITQPQYLLRYGDELAGVLGDRAQRLTPLGEIRDAGAPVVLSSDAPVCPPRPLEAVTAAVDRRTLTGERLGAGPQCLTLVEAWQAHTLHAAASVHREHAIGSLEAGKFADFVVLDQDPLHTDIESLVDVDVEATWVGGRQVYDRHASTKGLSA
ncbi:amidohydrolase [Mycolicibacterium chitae]|uniref:Amidohydrolase ytcJ n=2 Tax=Mycolicibacterium TaxID=1866885 RepID=A0A3S4RQ59_MYCCI|nr:amidohydrolase [Mycolicibacterium chitae]MCV7107364.1 amidohydrolase [Mycolicibacterium chitae]BBZ03041.1 amidohydrolase [Mycolicibacterium chitae]VEG46186.1 amidohydrolase ytcJ [Mycolicibacterium chitae]